ncbi:anthranilate synthase component I family protein [Patescibacteria group bacterium]|nr:anthranilate synthase component I family protein [Patescibacteria group bacterium]
MKISLSDIEKEGFAVLHGKWGGVHAPRSIIGLTSESADSYPHFQRMSIGYFAYPNPTFKNIIPSSRFYGYEKVIKQKKPPVVEGDFKTAGKLEQSVSKSQYIKKIKRIKELLAAGEIYQMCYCIRFRKKFSGSPYALFFKLTEVNPVDYSAYLNCGDFQIISSSPEHFFSVKNGTIKTTPIKGTISKKNKKNLEKLINSEKERAELDMITDLERNDVGKICEYGTLKLKKEREILELKNLWHTYSEVEGKLRSDVGQKEVIEAMFPGGSITGCPKKRAMEYIEKLEGLPRNIFTGSIGYISNSARIQCKCKGARFGTCTCHLHLNMDFNIAIRTILIKDGYLEFWAGGGIVADSDPDREYEECLLKAEKFLDIIKP